MLEAHGVRPPLVAFKASNAEARARAGERLGRP